MQKITSEFTLLQKVMLFTLFMNTIICGMFILVLEMTFVLTQEFVMPQSTQMFNLETERESNEFSNVFKRQVKREIQGRFHTLDSIMSLYEYIQTVKHEINQKPQQCLLTEYMDSYNIYSEFCYYNKANKTIDLHYNDTLDLIPLLTSLSLTLSLDNVLFLYYISHSKWTMFFEYPAANEDEAFYTDKNYLKHPSNFVKPTLPFDNYFIIVKAFRMINNVDGTYQGIISMDFTLTQYTNFENIKYYVTSDQGLLVIPNKTFTSLNKPYIYNQSITGLNYEDWLTIKKYKNSTLYNSLFDEEVYINTLWFPEFNIYLTLFQDTRAHKQQFSTMINSFTQWQQSMVKINLFVFLSFSIIVLMIQFKIISNIINPLRDIIITIENSWTHQDIEQFKAFFYLKLHSQNNHHYTIFIHLLNSLDKFLEPQKSQQCYAQEDLQYPLEMRLQLISQRIQEIGQDHLIYIPNRLGHTIRKCQSL